MYTCGPTVYDSTHAGHLIPPIVGDVIKRYLRSQGYEVVWAHNFTDVDDKIISRAQAEGVTAADIADRYIAEYLQVMKDLGIDTVDVYPRVSDHIEDIVAMIQTLIDKGHAYPANGDVYFDVTSFAEYGKLSGRTPEELLAGARVQVDEQKRNPGDFALWKKAKPGEPSWDSPWGPGRPGWHIECSAMSYKHLGYPVDIHGGGLDLIFPHHENEIAQSEAFESGQPFVRYWLHSGLLKLEAEKMSKSLGNFVSARELLQKYRPEVIRFYVLSHHYRSPREFGEQRLEEAQKAWRRLQATVERLREVAAQTSDTEPATKTQLYEAAEMAADRFRQAMANDFNSARAIGALFDLVNAANAALAQGAATEGSPDLSGCHQALSVFEYADAVLGIVAPPEHARVDGHDNGRWRQIADELLDILLSIREEARQERDWVRADHIRNRLTELGVQIEDTVDGTRHRWTI